MKSGRRRRCGRGRCRRGRGTEKLQQNTTLMLRFRQPVNVLIVQGQIYIPSGVCCANISLHGISAHVCTNAHPFLFNSFTLFGLVKVELPTE